MFKNKNRVDAEGRECTKCQAYKPWSAFPRDKGTATGHVSACQCCRTAAHKEWVGKNADHVEAKRKQNYAENLSKIKTIARESSAARRAALPEGQDAQVQRDWRIANFSRYTGYHRAYRASIGREELNKRSKIDRETHPLRHRMYDARKRANRRMGACPWADREAIARVYLEAARLTRETGVAYHVDHIVPLTSPMVQGLHNEFNLRAVPAEENLLKGNRLDEALLYRIDKTYWAGDGTVQ